MPRTDLGLRVCLLSCLVGLGSAWAQAPDYPATRTDDAVDVYQVLITKEVVDPYRWLEDSDDPEVQAWTEKQNQLTRRLLDQFGPQREALTERLDQLYAANVSSAPQVYGERYFYLKRVGLQNHAVLYVRTGGLDGETQVAVDPNAFSPDGTVAMDWWYPSPDGAMVAYGKSISGSERSTLYVRDVRSGDDLPLRIPDTPHCSLAWDADGNGFTYTRLPAPGSVPEGDENYYRHVYHHRLRDTDWQDDPELWGAGEPKEKWAGVSNSSDYRYQFLSTTLDWARNDLYIRKAGETEFHPVAVDLDGLFTGDVLGDKLYLHTNYEAPRYRIVVADVSNPGPEGWQDVVPQQTGVIDGFVIADGKLVVRIMENAYSRIMIYEPDGKLIKEVELPTLGSVSELSGRPDRSDLFFSFESFAYPPVVFRYDLRAHKMDAIDRMEVDVDLDRYETSQVWFNSKDGTRVPMFITHRKGLALDGSNPAVLYGYGGFNISLKPSFYRGVIPWLDAGGIWAVASIRGGGEFGQQWHLAGRLANKQNSYDDFIAAAEKLIADGYTSPQRLGARGGSNGGLLMGAMMVQRPDLFRAIHCAVPLLDMYRYQRFAMARVWIPEYGSADNPDQIGFIFSPYHHVRKGVAYPAVLFTAAESDTRVDPMHARKMAAAMQAATSSDHPILLWVERKAGHGAGKPLSKYVEDQVDIWTFFMWQLGVFETPTTSPASE